MIMKTGLPMQIKSITSFIVASVALVIFSTAGCEKPEGGTSPSGEHAEDHDGNDHSDDNGEDVHAAHGPYHGHIFSIDSPEYQAEWVKYKDNNIIRMYVLDGKAAAGVPVKVESFVVIPMVGNDDDLKFELVGEDLNEQGETAVYMLDDQVLSMSIPMGVKVQFIIDGKTFTGEIKAHKPLDH